MFKDKHELRRNTDRQFPTHKHTNAAAESGFQSQLHLQAEAIAREVLGNRTILDASEIAAARAEINQRLEALRRPEQREAA